MALAAETGMLEFRDLPLLQSGGLAAQIRRSLNNLLRETKNERVVKLRAFVAGPGDARRLQSAVSEIFSDHKVSLPVVSIVQVGALQDSRAQVAMEAVVETRKQANPQGLVFFSGQTAPTLPASIARLRKSMQTASVTHILRCTCFTSRIDGNGASLSKMLDAAFPGAASIVIQALRDPPDESATCEAVAQSPTPVSANTAPDGSPLVSLPSARATVVHAPRLVFTGLQLSFGNYLDDAREAFRRLNRSAATVAAEAAPVQVNAFSPDPAALAALRKMTDVPPSSFTVQPVEGLPGVDASAGVEEILASQVAASPIGSR